MVGTGHATPLIALDAVVIDTETTGLDSGKARLLEIARRAHRRRTSRTRAAHGAASCSPASPSPSAATAIHGIDAAKLADAPVFAAAWPEIASPHRRAMW